jgi:hypothetical protein
MICPMSATADKARALRLQRLKSMLEERLDNCAAALEFLISEIVAKAPQEQLWEQLHGAADRDHMEIELAAAYANVTSPRRLQQLDPKAQAAVLMHAADFHQGVVGDADGAQVFLERVQLVVPGHAESFQRLERRFEAQGDQRSLIRLYAIAGAADAKLGDVLASKVVNKIVPLPATQPLPDDACKYVAALARKHPALFDVIDAHCRKTKRFALAGELAESSLADENLPAPVRLKLRRRVIELYTGDASAPAKAIRHVEALLNDDPSDEVARKGAEKLLSSRDVSQRAAAALQAARRTTRIPSAQ